MERKQEKYDIVSLLAKALELPEVHNDEEIRVEVAEFIAKANSKIGKISLKEADYLYSNIFFYINKVRKLSKDSIYELIMNHLMSHSSLSDNTIATYVEEITPGIDFAYNQSGSSANPYLYGVTNEPNDSIVKYSVDQDNLIYRSMLTITRASECYDLPVVLLQAMYLMEWDNDLGLLEKVFKLNRIYSFDLLDSHLELVADLIEEIWVPFKNCMINGDDIGASYYMDTDIKLIAYLHIYTHTIPGASKKIEDVDETALQTMVYDRIEQITPFEKGIFTHHSISDTPITPEEEKDIKKNAADIETTEEGENDESTDWGRESIKENW